MPTRIARTAWNGGLQDGQGQVELTSSKVGTYDVSFPRRAADDAGGVTSPEELIAAAHSSCFNMALSNELGQAGFTPENVRTTASVTFVPGTGITGSHLNVSASIPGISAEKFDEIANGAKAGCPVSQALAGVDITIEATLA